MPKMSRVLLVVSLMLIAGCRLYQQERQKLAQVAASTVLTLATQGHEPLTQSTFRSSAPIASPKNYTQMSSLAPVEKRRADDAIAEFQSTESTDDRFDVSVPADPIADEAAVASVASGSELTVTVSPAAVAAPAPMPTISLCSLNISVPATTQVMPKRIVLEQLSDLAQMSKEDRGRIETALRQAAVAMKERKVNVSIKQFDEYLQKALSQRRVVAAEHEKARRIIVIDRNGNSAEL